ncbi:hypothetical protein F5B20DRAFT_580871 [Whalleya microplaca]|nr:hypothetical protein F5B20DRAFT_580871 [Whalleya microplaca]
MLAGRLQGSSLANVIQDRISAKISHKSRSRRRNAASRYSEDKTLKAANEQDRTTYVAPTTARSIQQSSQPQSADSSDLGSAALSFTPDEIEQSLQWLIQTVDSAQGQTDMSNPFEHLSPLHILSMEYEMAVAEALYAQRLQNLNTALPRNGRCKRNSIIDNSSTVKLHGILLQKEHHSPRATSLFRLSSQSVLPVPRASRFRRHPWIKPVEQGAICRTGRERSCVVKPFNVSAHGIHIQYQKPKTGSRQTQTQWATATRTKNARKANSLVEFLGNRSVDLTGNPLHALGEISDRG